MTRRTVIGTTDAGAQFMTTGFMRATRRRGWLVLTWRRPLAVSRARILARAGFAISQNGTRARVRVVHAQEL